MAIRAKGAEATRPARFNFDLQRTTCESFSVGYLQSFRFDEGGPMGMAAGAQVSDFIYCGLVGLLDRVRPMIPVRIEWIDHALSGSEFPAERSAFQRAELLKAKALYHWLAGDSELALAAWHPARAAQELSMIEPGNYSKNDMKTYGLDDQMALCLLAGEYAGGIATFQRLWPGKDPRVARAEFPRDWGYLACRNQLRPTLSEEELLHAGQRMLRRWLDDPWLGRGQAARAAMWLKAVYWLPDRTLSSEHTLLKAYDHLPSVTRQAYFGD